MKPGEPRMGLPCVLHLPDMGTLRITGAALLVKDRAEGRSRPRD